MHERVVFNLSGLAFERKQIPRLVGMLVVEVIERVGGHESGALQAGSRGFESPHVPQILLTAKDLLNSSAISSSRCGQTVQNSAD